MAFATRHFGHFLLLLGSSLIFDQGSPASRWMNTVQLSNVPSAMSLMHSKRACSSTGSFLGGWRRVMLAI